ncbi:MAG: hypothetical protein ACETV1_00495 [Candidatus Bathyarchaeia archaeon]
MSKRSWDLLSYILFITCAVVVFPYPANLLYTLGLFVILTLLYIRSKTQRNRQATTENPETDK